MFPQASHFMRWLIIGILPAMVWATPIAAQGKGPRVQFDFPHAVECRDITSQEFARQYPYEKTIEAAFRISTRIVEGREKDLVELVVEIRSRSERLRVAEFLPGTTLESDLIGEIEMKETDESIGTQGVSAGAALPLPYGDLTFSGSPSANLAHTRRTTRTETRRLVPPSQVVVSSGTMYAEHGVFFKLRPSHHGAFEDMHEFTVRFVVPRHWRGDWVQLTCRAMPGKSGHSFVAPKPSAASVCMGLHLAGDIEAQQAARRLAHAQIKFLEPSPQSVAHRLASSVNQLADYAQAKASVCLAKFRLDRAEDALPASNSKGSIGLDVSPATKLQAACDAMSLLGGDFQNAEAQAGFYAPAR